MANKTVVLEREEILNALILELENIKTNSQTLQNAGTLVNGAVDASNNLVQHSAKMLDLVRSVKDALQLELRSLQDFLQSGEKRNVVALEKLDEAIEGIEVHDKELAKTLGEIRQLIIEAMTTGFHELDKSFEERFTVLDAKLSGAISKMEKKIQQQSEVIDQKLDSIQEENRTAIANLQKVVDSLKTLSLATLVILSLFIGVLVYLAVKVS